MYPGAEKALPEFPFRVTSRDGTVYLVIERDQQDGLMVRRFDRHNTRLDSYWRMWALSQVWQLNGDCSCALRTTLSRRMVSVESPRPLKRWFWRFVDALEEITALPDPPLRRITKNTLSHHVVWRVQHESDQFEQMIRTITLPLWMCFNFYLRLDGNTLHLIRQAPNAYAGIRQRDVCQFVEWQVAQLGASLQQVVAA